MLRLDSPVGEIAGVGEVKGKSLRKLGVATVRDLLYHFPRGYQNRGDTKNIAEIKRGLGAGESAVVSTVLCVASNASARMIRRGMNILKFRAFDETGYVEMVFFNQNYLKETFVKGATFRFWGRISYENGTLRMVCPIFEAYYEGGHLPPIVPVYRLSSGLSQRFMQGIVKEALSAAEREVRDIIPEDLQKKHGLISKIDAFKAIHFPSSETELEAAKRRLCFEEIYVKAAALASERTKTDGEAIPFDNCGLDEFKKSLPYELTGAQKRALGEICSDMSGRIPMRRILIGDVGSGKTAVAEGAAFACAESGHQCAVMVPTEILAKQHWAEFKKALSPFGINVELLCGSTSAAERKRILATLKEESGIFGRTDVIIGTHALLTEDVEFSSLGLVITDEQHRFGVMQRAALASKGKNVHTLVMSATPIPRTLSLVCYGDLDLSRLDEMPPGRSRVDTFVVDERYRDRINTFIRTHARAGNRTYVVCPLVDESAAKARKALEKSIETDPEEMSNITLFEEDMRPLKSTAEFARELALCLPDLNIGTVHGKMKPSQKDRVMKEFADGEIDVLVSTTVIEVGVNVPEATLMIVENAERFGLSQLHQLRGRVGRGDRKSFCILVSDSKSKNAKKRLSVMKTCYDGYEIAEEDLKLRGAGDFLFSSGQIRQHGFTSPFGDEAFGIAGLTEEAVCAARDTVNGDPTLDRCENSELKKAVLKIRHDSENIIS